MRAAADRGLPLTERRGVVGVGLAALAMLLAGCPDDAPDRASAPAADAAAEAAPVDDPAPVRASCARVAIDGSAPTCRLSAACRTGEHAADCSANDGRCICRTTSAGGGPLDVPYEPAFCETDGRPTADHARFAAVARACGFPL